MSGNSSASDASSFSFFLVVDASSAVSLSSSCFLLPSEVTWSLGPTNSGDALVVASGPGDVESGVRIAVTSPSCEEGSGRGSGGMFSIDVLRRDGCDKMMTAIPVPVILVPRFGLSGHTFVTLPPPKTVPPHGPSLTHAYFHSFQYFVPNFALFPFECSERELDQPIQYSSHHGSPAFLPTFP